MVIADETSSANLRWAENTLTTNGVARARRLTVIAIDRRPDGAAAGIVSRAGVDPDEIEDVVREAEHAAAEATPAEDAETLGGPGTRPSGKSEPRWDAAPAPDRDRRAARLRGQLGEALREARAAGRLLFGFAEHDLACTFLGTSTGLRLRHDQPAGRLELNAKSADLARSAWTGAATRDFTDVDIAALDAELSAAPRLGRSGRSPLPAGRYETLLPPTAVADLMIYLYWSAGARDAADGPHRVQQAGRRDPGRRAAEPPAACTLCQRPADARPARARRSSSRMRPAPTPRSSTTACRWTGPPGSSDGSLAALHSTRHSAALTGLPVTPADRQPDPGDLGGAARDAGRK